MQKTDRWSVLLIGLGVLLLLPGKARAKPARLTEIPAAIRACEGPTAALARARVQQGNAAVTAAGVLPNPTVSFQLNRSLSGPQDYEAIVGVAVPLGLGGSWFVLQDAARAEQKALLRQGQADRFDIALGVRRGFTNASVTAARLRVLQEQDSAVAALIKQLSALQQAGEEASYDVLRLQAQQATLQLAIRSQRGKLAAERAWIEALVGAPIQLSGDAAAQLHKAVAAVRPSAGNGARRTEAHPVVAQLQAQAEVHRLRASAAERRWAPDVNVFLGYRNVGGLMAQTGHGLSLNLSVPVTFFDHGQGEVARERAGAALVRARAAMAQRKLAARRRAASARLDALGRPRAVDAESLASRWVRSATRLYFAGEGSLLDVLQAQRALTQAKLAKLDVVEQRLAANLAWMRTAGRLLDARLQKACGSTAKAGAP